MFWNLWMGFLQLHGLLERFALAGSPKSIDVLPAYTVSSVEPPLDGQTFGMAKLMNADGSVSGMYYGACAPLRQARRCGCRRFSVSRSQF
jgi:hypothetical protein